MSNGTCIKIANILFIVTLFSIVFNYYPSLSLAKEKESIALLEFEVKGDISRNKARVIEDQLRSQLLNTGKFYLVEKEKIDNILKKDGDIIKSWEKVAKVAVERSGRNINLLGAKRIITGDIFNIFEKYLINARMINILDKEVLYSISEEVKSFTDNDINTTAKEIIDKLTIKENEYSSDKKPSIVIYEFEAEGGSNVETSIISDRLRFYLVSTKIYNVLERGKPLKIGLLLPVNKIIAGSVIKLSEKYLINARMIDVKTGKILVETFEEFKSLNDNDIKTTTKKVLDKFN